ncbi:MAG TPA: hypothetical protein VGO66_03445 [Solirubrobacterales bacterium]|jgi:hypothetical protein|nr:hypothetical protein [Solirubrobacterales bacterium]
MKLNHITSRRGVRAKIAALTATALLGMAVFAGSASAASCGYTGAKQVFAPWGDQHAYVLAPDGGFEAGGAGWALSRGAAVVAGNESYYLNATTDSRSLSLPAGSSAASPPICMSLDTPIFRLVARNTGDPSSRLKVEAIYSLLGLVRTNIVNTVTAGPSWTPAQQMSPVLGLSTIVGTLIPSAIQIRITPLDSKGQWQVDDLFVDPFARH